MPAEENEERPSVEGILDKIENSPYGELLRDERKLESKLIELMENSPDRTLAEMGRGLRSGEVSWQGLADIPGYSDVLNTGFEKMREIDLAQVSGELDELFAEQEDAEQGSAEPEVRDGDDENDDFSQHRYLGG